MASLLNHTSLMRTLSDKERFKKDAICIMQGSCELIINLSSPIIKNIFKTPATVVFSTNNSEGLLLNRLSSFKNEKNPWVLNFITPGQMARAGFYYTGVKDRVECMYCFEKFDNWCHSDDPLVVHKRVSPYCAFFDEDQGYDTCGLYGPPMTYSNEDRYAEEIETYLKAIGVVQNVRISCYKLYATLESRIKTFETCTIQLKHSIHSLSKAGFFYAGDGSDDKTVCFCCGQCLESWREHDDPMREHASWSPKCLYLRLKKGDEFVNDVMKIEENLILERQASNLTADRDADREDASTSMIKTKLKAMVIEKGRQEINENNTLPTMDLQLSQQNLNTIPDSLLCKICFTHKIKVAILPCCHATKCAQCTMALDDCAICRRPFSTSVRINLYLDKLNETNLNQSLYSSSQCDVLQPTLNQNLLEAGEEESNNEDLIQLPSGSSQCDPSESDLNPILCKVCGKAEMGAVFLPCRHVCACFKCALKMHTCPVCTKIFFGIMQIYL